MQRGPEVITSTFTLTPATAVVLVVLTVALGGGTFAPEASSAAVGHRETTAAARDYGLYRGVKHPRRVGFFRRASATRWDLLDGNHVRIGHARFKSYSDDTLGDQLWDVYASGMPIGEVGGNPKGCRWSIGRIGWGAGFGASYAFRSKGRLGYVGIHCGWTSYGSRRWDIVRQATPRRYPFVGVVPHGPSKNSGAGVAAAALLLLLR